MAGLHAVRLTPRVYWVGAIDWNVRDIHGFWCPRGTTYNAYLILADRITLIDTVKKEFYEELMSRIASVIDPTTIDVVVSLHAEMDHSGCLPQVLKAVQPSASYASTVGKETLQSHFHDPVLDAMIPLPDGGTVDLGNAELEVIHTAMMHWPDSMMALLRADGVLFSQDTFGLHLATTQRFDDDLDLSVLERFTAAYYANILLPFAPVITKGIAKINPLLGGLQLIAPSHGPAWRTHRDWVVANYVDWSAQRPTMKVVILFDTMWGSVERLARAFADGLAEGGADARVLRARDTPRAEVATELLTAGGLVVGSSTLNRGILPTVADPLHYLKGLRPRNLIGAVLGSYGWGGGANKVLGQFLKEMGVKVIPTSDVTNYVPDGLALEQCRADGVAFAAALLSHCGAPTPPAAAPTSKL